jgi:ABC-type uncharacterized transport system involved in gliding motility auxiliary subunit
MSRSLLDFHTDLLGELITKDEFAAIKQRKHAKRARKTAKWRKSRTERRRIKLKRRK